MARIIDTTEKNLIGHKVKQLRKKHHMSQKELSEKLETYAVYICRGSISRIEDQSRTVTDIELYAISKIFADFRLKNYLTNKKDIIKTKILLSLIL